MVVYACTGVCIHIHTHAFPCITCSYTYARAAHRVVIKKLKEEAVSLKAAVEMSKKSVIHSSSRLAKQLNR